MWMVVIIFGSLSNVAGKGLKKQLGILDFDVI
jgi:hypothetical protein